MDKYKGENWEIGKHNSPPLEFGLHIVTSFRRGYGKGRESIASQWRNLTHTALARWSMIRAYMINASQNQVKFYRETDLFLGLQSTKICLRIKRSKGGGEDSWKLVWLSHRHGSTDHFWDFMGKRLIFNQIKNECALLKGLRLSHLPSLQQKVNKRDKKEVSTYFNSETLPILDSSFQSLCSNHDVQTYHYKGDKGKASNQTLNATKTYIF